jgi:SAM-dependent methyltransferase
MLTQYLSALQRFVPGGVKTASMKFFDPGRERFLCPICGYFGPFLRARAPTLRQHVYCACCGSLERHRLMWLVLQSLWKGHKLSEMRALHFAPERCLQKKLAPMFHCYETADISGKNVDYQVDMCNLPFVDASFDFVIASHVLHYIRDEASALHNLRRILRVGGIAILPVPIFGDKTVQYAKPISNHMRAPGRDYFERCYSVFSAMRVYSSHDFEPRYQTWIYEDRSHWPSQLSLRPCSPGEKHQEYVPVCFR